VTDLLKNSLFLRACRHEPVERTPVWIMRQAGRYLKEYREIRAQGDFLDLCKSPERASRVTLLAVEILEVDAAIIFSDLLIPFEPMGVGLSYEQGSGPVIARPVTSSADVDGLKEVNAKEDLSYLFRAVQRARKILPPDIPLLGFGGAPFTLASYLIEGHGSKDYAKTKAFMKNDLGAWNSLMERLVVVACDLMKLQIEAGAQAVQIFDSWVGCLSEEEYRQYALPHTQALVRAIRDGLGNSATSHALPATRYQIPIIHFATNTAHLLGAIRETGATVIGVDWRVPLSQAWDQFKGAAVQGNLDPQILLSSKDQIRAGVEEVLKQAAGRPGHIFNLGHGILPDTPVENAKAMVAAVKEFSSS